MNRTLTGRRVVGGALALLCLTAVAGCDDSEERFGAGFDAGFDAGYASACDPDADELDDEFEDAVYARGYAAGAVQGSNRCARDQRAGRVR